MNVSSDPVISYLFGEVLGHHKPQSILDFLIKSKVTNIYDFFYLEEFDLPRYDHALLKIFKDFLYQELKDSDIEFFDNVPVDSQFWFDLSNEVFKAYRDANRRSFSSSRQDNPSMYDSPTIQTRPNINYDSTTRNFRRTDNVLVHLGDVQHKPSIPSSRNLRRSPNIPVFRANKPTGNSLIVSLLLSQIPKIMVMYST